jgi:calcineurin-like phosphoesterase
VWSWKPLWKVGCERENPSSSFFGDLVRGMTIRYLEGSLPRLRQELGVDFVVANGENADLTDPALGKAGMHWETVDRLLRANT